MYSMMMLMRLRVYFERFPSLIKYAQYIYEIIAEKPSIYPCLRISP